MSVVLVVEDELHIRRFLRQALEDNGDEVLEATSVASGLALAGDRKPDLIILDLGLPDADGLEFIRALRLWSDIALLVLSARS